MSELTSDKSPFCSFAAPRGTTRTQNLTLPVGCQHIPEEDADAVLDQIRSPATAPPTPAAALELSLAGSPQQHPQALPPNGDAPDFPRSSSSPPHDQPRGLASPSSSSSPVRARGGSLVDGVGVGVAWASGGADGSGGGGGGRNGLRSPPRSGGAARRRVNVSDHHGVRFLVVWGRRRRRTTPVFVFGVDSAVAANAGSPGRGSWAGGGGEHGGWVDRFLAQRCQARSACGARGGATPGLRRIHRGYVNNET